MVRAASGLVTGVLVLAVGVAVAQPPPAPVMVTTLPRPAELPQPIPAPLATDAPARLPPAAVTSLPGPPVPIPEPPPDVCPHVPILPPLVPAAPPGWFGSVEFGILFPDVTNGLVAPVSIPQLVFVDPVALSLPFLTPPVRTPTAELDVADAWQLTLGYRLRNDLGALLLSYRGLATQGEAIIRDFDFLGDGFVRSRLDLNAVTFAYATAEHPLGALWGIRWEVGARLATIFFDSQVDGMFLGQKTSNHFVGAGPMAALNVTRELPPSGLALYSRVEAAEVLGRVQQRFAKRLGDPAAPFGFGATEQDGSQGVPMLGVQAGLSWLSRPDGRYRLTTGYQFEHYWAVGKLGASHGDVLAQGLFLRAEFNY